MAINTKNMNGKSKRWHRALAVAALALLAGCYRPQGSLMPSSTGAYTYISTETFEQTVTLMDMRSDKPIFTQPVPPGQQLTLQFLDGGGDDPVLRPDRMVFELQPIGTMTGKLANQISVPAAGARRIDVAVTQGQEYRVPVTGPYYVPPDAAAAAATTGPPKVIQRPTSTGGMYDN